MVLEKGKQLLLKYFVNNGLQLERAKLGSAHPLPRPHPGTLSSLAPIQPSNVEHRPRPCVRVTLYKFEFSTWRET